MKNFFSKKTIWLLGFFIVLVAGATFWKINFSSAGAITSMSVSVSDQQYTFQFKPASNIPAGGKINIVFETGGSYNDSTELPIEGSTLNLTKKAGTSSQIGDLDYVVNNWLVAEVDTKINGGSTVTIVIDGFENPPVGRYPAIFHTANASDELIDGAENNSDSIYRAYYNIGTPIAYGRVLDPDGDPAASTWVDVDTNDTTSGSHLWGYGNTDELGYFSISELEGTGDPLDGASLRFTAYASSDTNWGNSAPVTKIYSTGSTINVGDIQFTEPTKTIRGTVKYPDGTPVTNAKVEMWSTGGGMGWKEVDVNSNGVYSTLIQGGQWDVMPGTSGLEEEPDWAYGMMPGTVCFKNDESEESRTLNFTVQRANSYITGKVILPDGSVPSDTSVFHVGAMSMTGGGNNTQLNSNGTFSVRIPSGSYQLEIDDRERNYAQPDMDSITVGDDETVNAGTIQLIERNSRITAKFVDENGDPLTGAEVHAFRKKGMGWATDSSNSNGNLTLNVFAGTWMFEVGLLVHGEHNYVIESTPPPITIAANETKSLGILTMVDTNATITGNIVDEDGKILSDIQGFVFADKTGQQAFMGPGMGGIIDRGRYTISVIPGTYNVGLGIMPGSGYSSSGTSEVTVAEDQTVTRNITIYENDMTVTGTIKDEDGNIVKNTFMEIFATGGMGCWQNAFLDQASGTYELELASAIDNWNMGYFVDPASGYFSQNLTDSKVSGNSGDTITKNITVRKIDATISGVVLDGNGQPMDNVFVFADNRGLNAERQEAGYMGPMFMQDNFTDSNGEFTIEIPHGTYKVGASLPPGSRSDLINPNLVEVEVGANETISNVTLSFLNANVEVSGKVELDGEAESAFIWAYSDEGGYAQTESDANGDYTLNVTEDDEWHLGVNSDVDETNDYIEGSEQIVSTEDTTEVDLDFDLTTQEDGLITPVTKSFTASNSQVSNLSDGSSVTIPANAMATGGTVSLSASSTSELPHTTSLKPLTTGLELNANNLTTGSSITSFNSDVMVTIPYDEDAVEAGLVTEDDLVAAYWDENNGVWQPMENYSIDEENNTVSFSTGHFTTFAVVSDIAGSGSLSSEGVTSGARPKIYDWKAERYFTLAEDPKEKLKLLLEGLHMHDDSVVSIGYKEADSVSSYSGGKRVIAKFEWKDLHKDYDPMRYIRVINPDSKSRKVYKQMDLRDIPLRVPDGPIDDSTTEGISNTQLILKNNGFYHHPEVTGYFGSITRQALREFQIHHGLLVTSIVDEATHQKLLEARSNL